MANTCSSECFSSQGSPFSSGAPSRARPRRTAQAGGDRPAVRHALVDRAAPLRRRRARRDLADRAGEPPARAPTCTPGRRSCCPSCRGRSAASRRGRDNRRVDLDLVFLGTSGSAPTASRAPAALLVRRGGDRLLFDCGEGTQRQLMRSTVGLPDLEEIFITHYHGDHYLGLPGMLKTFQLRQREVPLTVYGPPGLRDLFSGLRRVFGKLSLPARARRGAAGRGARARRLPHPRLPGRPRHLGRRLRGRRARAARSVRQRGCRRARDSRSGPSAGALQHGESITLADGRVFTPDAVIGAARPGRRIVIPGDTAPVETVRVLAEGADVLVHEATFTDEERDRAATRSHSTALQAAEIARDAGVRLLALTHVSPRYFGGELAQGGAGGLPGDGRAARLRRDRGAVRRARRAAADPSRSAAAAQRTPRRRTGITRRLWTARHEADAVALQFHNRV